MTQQTHLGVGPSQFKVCPDPETGFLLQMRSSICDKGNTFGTECWLKHNTKLQLIH